MEQLVTLEPTAVTAEAPPTSPASVQTAATASDESLKPQDLRARVLAEYREMPGLILTLPQAARLFSIERTQCEAALDSLVAQEMLVARGGRYLRAGHTVASFRHPAR